MREMIGSHAFGRAPRAVGKESDYKNFQVYEAEV